MQTNTFTTKIVNSRHRIQEFYTKKSGRSNTGHCRTIGCSWEKCRFSYYSCKEAKPLGKRIFKRGKDHILYNPETNNPYIIRTGSKSMPVLLFYSSEVDKMCYSLDRYFGGEN